MYDTMRDASYFNVRSKADMSQLNLPNGKIIPNNPMYRPYTQTVGLRGSNSWRQPRSRPVHARDNDDDGYMFPFLTYLLL